MGSLDPDHGPLLNFFSGLYEDCPEGMQNFKSIAVDVLELLAFSGLEFRVSPSRDPGYTPF